MPKTKVLITVKTYPSLSSKYDELVCTAGFLEDGTWIRIYPIQFRKKSFDQRYRKYDWIEINLVKNNSDFRPESFRPYSHDTEIKILDHIDTKGNWHLRKEIVFKKKIYTDLNQLIEDAKNRELLTSLATFKPNRILDFHWEEVDRNWDEVKLDKIKQQRNTLFSPESEDLFEVVQKLPYKFFYIFEDEKGTKSKMMIEDWEIGQLYWNCLKRHEGNERKAVEDVRKKYFDVFAKTRDLHFFLGTTKAHHFRGRNPFVIIGTFHPKIEIQQSLF